MREDVTEDSIIDEEPEMVIIKIIAVIIEAIVTVIGGIFSAIKNLVEWIYCEIDWEKTLIFLLAVSIPACLAGMFVYSQKYEYPHCETLCVKYANNATECLKKCKGETK